MLRRITALLAIVVLLGSPSLAASVQQSPSFTFVHIADVHLGAPGSRTEVPKVFSAIKAAGPAFVIDGGDATEMGRATEYAEYDKLAATLGVPIHAVPGNHDARWFDAGKQEFRRRYPTPYRSFDHGPVHFVLLDTAIDAQTHGHFDAPMLRWLADDLKAIGTERPVFLFFHHPIGFRPLKFIDNEQALYDLLAPYNVRGIFTGHGHLNYQWQVNNIPHFMTQSALEGGWRKVAVYATEFETTEGRFPLARPAPASVEVRSAAVKADKLEIDVASRNLPSAATVYARSSGAWQPLVRGADGRWTGSIAVPSQAGGLHDLRIYATAEPNLPGQVATADQWIRRDLGAAWTAQVRYETPVRGASVRWRHQAGGAIQGPPAVVDGRVIFTSRDSVVTALDARTGNVIWRTGFGFAPITGGVTAAYGKLFVSTTGGILYALHPATGAFLWHKALNEPILSEPEAGGNLLFTGTAAGYLYGINPETGELVWRTAAGAAVRARPTYANGSLFAGTWGGEVLGLEAGSGRLAWRTRLTSNPYLSPANVPLLHYRGRIYATNSTGGALKTGLWALDAGNGRILMEVAETAGYSSPFMRGAELVANTPGGRLLALDPLSGQRKWDLSLGTSVFDSYSVPFGGGSVTGGLEGLLVAASPSGILWRADLGDTYIFARPAVDGKMVFAGTMDGMLHALEAVTVPPVPAAGPFADTAGHWSAPTLQGARLHGLASGYTDGTFRPDHQMTRAELAVLVARYLNVQAPSAGFQSGLADLQGHWAAKYVMALEERKIVSGAPGPDNKLFYRPDSPVSRAEAATMIARMLGRTSPSPAFESRFLDVLEHWGRPSAQALEEIGLVSGYRVDGGYRFSPDGRITRAEAITILMRAMN